MHLCSVRSRLCQRRRSLWGSVVPFSRGFFSALSLSATLLPALSYRFCPFCDFVITLAHHSPGFVVLPSVFWWQVGLLYVLSMLSYGGNVRLLNDCVKCYSGYVVLRAGNTEGLQPTTVANLFLFHFFVLHIILGSSHRGWLVNKIKTIILIKDLLFASCFSVNDHMLATWMVRFAAVNIRCETDNDPGCRPNELVLIGSPNQKLVQHIVPWKLD